MSSIILIQTNIQQPKRKLVVRKCLFLKIAERRREIPKAKNRDIIEDKRLND